MQGDTARDKTELRPYARRINFYETDQMGIVHHSNYIRYFEEARVDFMEQIGYGYEKAVQAGIDFAVLGVTCEYRSMVRFGETVHIFAGVSALSPSRITVRYRVVDAQSGALRAEGESRHCYYDNDRRRPVSLMKTMPELYALFEGVRENEKNKN